MVEQEEIFKYIKRYKIVKWSSEHLSKIFKCSINNMNDALLKMHKNTQKYPDLDREPSIRTAKNGRPYTRYLYYIKNEE